MTDTKELLVKYVRKSFKPIQLAELTAGVEHEFFLLNKSMRSVNHDEGQEFLLNLSRRKGWGIKYYREGDQKIISRVSFEEDHGRYSAVKYDHHPHLFELASGFSNRIEHLADLLNRHFDSINEAAMKAGLHLSKNPILNEDLSSNALNSDWEEFKKLRNYREILLREAGYLGDVPSLRNYASGIAATQVHIGGLDWVSNKGLLAALYSVEPENLLYGARLSIHDFDNVNYFLKKRWEGYRKVFHGSPLVGFPDLPDWSIENWSSALLKTPIAGVSLPGLAGKTLDSSEPIVDLDLESFFIDVRDLQIIRPKRFGTLEFRADPMMPGVKEVLALVARRVGICYAALAGRIAPSRSFRESYELWWKLAQGDVATIDATDNLTDLAYQSLPKAERKFLII